ncbi:MAG TPA: hypothetical protein VKV31_01700 [bacterium]|nr:hypothetical protein [bacterium]
MSIHLEPTAYFTSSSLTNNTRVKVVVSYNATGGIPGCGGVILEATSGGF